MMATTTFVGSGNTFTAGDNSLIVKAATGGSETLRINNVTGLNVDANFERVELVGNLADYKFVITGTSGIQIVNSAGVTIATIPSLNQAETLAFADGSAVLTQTGATAANLNGVALSTTTPAAITTTLNTGDKSSIAGGGGSVAGQTFTLTTATQTIVMTTGNDTVDGSTTANSADGDNVVDSTITDSDVANIKFTTAPTTGPTFANIETINLALDYFNPTFDASKVTNGTIIVTTAQDGNAKASFTGIGTNGVKIKESTGITTLTIDGTSGSSDSTTVTLQGGASALNVGTTTALENVAIVSNGSATNVVTLDDNTSTAGTNTYTVTGSQTLTLKASAADVAGDTLTKSLDSGKTVDVQFTALAATADLKNVAANTFTVNSTSSALGANTLTFAAGTTSLTVSGTDQLDNAASTLAATGAATTDVLNLSLAADQANIVASTFETVNLTYTGSTVDLSLATLVGGTATTPTTDFKIVSGRNVALTSATAKSIDFSGMTGTATATLTAVANTTANVSVTGTANADTLNLGASLTTGKGTVNAGAGNDTITGGAGADSITAGDGNDSIAGSAGNDSVDGGAGNDIINSGAGNNFSVGGTGDDSFLPTTGVDAIVAGTGDDTVTISGANLTSADTFVGGDGTDTLSITTAVVAAGSSLDNVSGFETVSFAALGPESITAVDSLIAAGATLTVNVATPTGIFTWNGAAELDGNLKLTVSSANFAHVLTGGAGNDTIDGGTSTAPESIKGGAGADTLTVSGAAAHTVNGGAGADTISLGTSVAGVLQLSATTDSTTTSYDSVTGYTSASEVINLNSISGLTSTVAANVTASATVGGIATGLYTASTSGAFTSLSDAIARVGADVKTVGKAVVFNYGSDAYVFEDVDGTSATTNDILIKLVGITAASMADAANVLTVT